MEKQIRFYHGTDYLSISKRPENGALLIEVGLIADEEHSSLFELEAGDIDEIISALYELTDRII